MALPRRPAPGGAAAEPGRLRLGPGRLADLAADALRRPARRARLAAGGDAVGLAALRTTSLAHADPVFRDVVAPVCQALQAVVERRVRRRRRGCSSPCSPAPAALGGSAAQREVLEDTLVYALAAAGRSERAAEVLDERLSRRAVAARRPSAGGAGAPDALLRALD